MIRTLRRLIDGLYNLVDFGDCRRHDCQATISHRQIPTVVSFTAAFGLVTGRVHQTWSWVWDHPWVGLVRVGLSQSVSLPSLYCKSLLANCTSYGELFPLLSEVARRVLCISVSFAKSTNETFHLLGGQ